ncbi:hypothetical protein RV07_GL003829 [Enterococcus malodoratus]|nr:hypothetical protein RV07_GL003829 [Enterococcus malodoratus]
MFERKEFILLIEGFKETRTLYFLIFREWMKKVLFKHDN